MKDKERFEFWIKKENRARLKQASKLLNTSEAKVINHLIEEHLINRLDYLRSKARELAKELNTLQEEISDLETEKSDQIQKHKPKV